MTEGPAARSGRRGALLAPLGICGLGAELLRRSFCSHALPRGASIEAVRAMGGWSSLAVVQRYLVSVEDEQRRAVERLGELSD